MYSVTVDQALARGRRTILLPQLLIFVGLPVITFLLARDQYIVMLSPMFVLIAAGLAAVYRAYAIPAWMIWAFSNVRNVHELKRRAEFAYLIPGEINKGFRKFEVWTQEQRLQWQQLDYRFNEADTLTDQPDLPAETHIYNSLLKGIFSLFGSLLVFGFGLLLLIFTEGNFWKLSVLWSYLMSLLFMAIGIYMLWLNFKTLSNRSARLILTDQGLQTGDSRFYSWSEVMEIGIISKGMRYRTFYLQFWVKGVKTEFDIDGLTSGRKKIDRLMRIYRGRFMERM